MLNRQKETVFELLKTDFSQQIFLIGDNGDVVPVAKLSDNDSVYYCWWD